MIALWSLWWKRSWPWRDHEHDQESGSVEVRCRWVEGIPQPIKLDTPRWPSVGVWCSIVDNCCGVDSRKARVPCSLHE